MKRVVRIVRTIKLCRQLFLFPLAADDVADIYYDDLNMRWRNFLGFYLVSGWHMLIPAFRLVISYLFNFLGVFICILVQLKSIPVSFVTLYTA